MCFERLVIKLNIDNKSFIFQPRYLDDIIIIYAHITHSHTDTEHCQLTQNNFKFSFTQEIYVNISFLDLLINRRTQSFEMDIQRKPVSTETVIHFSSNHPTRHRKAAFRFPFTKKHQLPLTPKNQNTNGIGHYAFLHKMNSHYIIIVEKREFNQNNKKNIF